jgi:hypothetical protein
MRAFIFAIVASALAACESEAPSYQWRVVTLPDGTQGAAVTCPHDMGICYERAGRACNYGYDVLDRDGHAAVVSEGRAYGNGTMYAARYGSEYVYRGTLLIRCRAAR